MYFAHDGSPAEIPFIDDSSEYLRTISDRLYLEEAGYWGLVALRERESAEYADIENANDEKYLGQEHNVFPFLRALRNKNDLLPLLPLNVQIVLIMLYRIGNYKCIINDVDRV